jgi:hypothetical protein
MPTISSAKRITQEGAILQREAIQSDISTVDEIVNEQAIYTELCEEQSAVFRQNVEEFKRESQRLQ